MNKHLLPTPGSVTRIDRNDVEEALESWTTTTIRTNKNCKKCPTPDDVHYCATLGVSFWGNDDDEDDKKYKKNNLNQVIASGRILDQDILRVSQIKQNDNDNHHHPTINRHHSNNRRRPWTNHAKRFLTSYQPPSE
ncbi:hypothetical protein FRACYDRAFT_272696 [Fragilariopsis cylindrus CCMP1102]|uniref:Uncharacterized protein n=1 Tax=Fragilariopsis cylindrus CCMP1102 TaxID=635003 RepID=A0A1E7EL61_9STRA|nr:hypothetical protein FRACYDRAFT_272696 [Fragilariopsis cylindrus CCMP1102]|eukprot:OEU06652.1 hypothetical protein FRACYDRAFT_272696 [Fragilariopsis cylindrus CCMP1102]